MFDFRTSERLLSRSADATKLTFSKKTCEASSLEQKTSTLKSVEKNLKLDSNLPEKCNMGNCKSVYLCSNSTCTVQAATFLLSNKEKKNLKN